MHIAEITNHLILDEQGIYRSKTSQKISYPSDGHRNCFLLEDPSFWFQHRNNIITSVIKLFSPEGAIIDVGGGNGYVTRGILDAGYDAVLLEPGIEGAVNGKVTRKISKVICSTFSDACFRSTSLDAIGCFDVIEHIENDRQFIEQLHSALKPNGLLYVTLPSYQWLWSQSDVTGEHYRRYNKAMVSKLMAHRFEIIHFSYFFSVLTIPIFIFRALPFRLKLFKNKNVLSKSTEHGTNRGFGVNFFNWRLKKELLKVVKGNSLRFGASCMIVTRKLG